MISRISALFTLSIVCTFLGWVPGASARIFTNVDGKTLDVELLTLQGDTVRFRRIADGRVFHYPLHKFSVKDRYFIEQEKKAGRLSAYEYKGLNPNKVTPLVKSENHVRASAAIDGFLQQHWREKGVMPAARTDDATFLRRAYLKIIGRIPTHAEAIHFLDDASPNKRVHLVDKLLDSPGFVSHQFNFWADVLRVKTMGDEGGRYGGVYYAPWLKDQIRSNVPYDDFVKSLLTAEGYPWDNPAAAYYLRDAGMPLDNMAMTTQIFLGTQLQCAQCHDHPTDVWTQKEFYEFSAFTYGVQTRVNANKQFPELGAFVREMKDLAYQRNGGEKPPSLQPSLLRTTRELFEPLRWRVSHTSDRLRLPKDYEYDEALADQPVQPQLLFGDSPGGGKDGSERVHHLADWMVAEENPRFTLVVANRMWKQAMGKGLIEPVDNITEDTMTDIPELMAYLEELMKSVDYDLKQYLRVLYQTKFFQREAVIDNPDLADDYQWQGPVFLRMSAEQIWDSLVTLMTPEIDNIVRGEYSIRNRRTLYSSGHKPVGAQYVDDLSLDQLQVKIEEYTEADIAYIEVKEQLQVLRSENKKFTPEMRVLKNRAEALRAQKKDLLNPNPVAGNEEEMDMSMMMSANMMDSGSGRKNQSWVKNVRRASELDSPQRNGHLLEVFGQSDRDLIENADQSSNIIQALFLMNSEQTNVLMAERSAPVLEARLASTPAEKIETLYVGFLSRKPTALEQEALLPYFTENPEKARQRIIWAMMNTQQFLFIQ